MSKGKCTRLLQDQHSGQCKCGLEGLLVEAPQIRAAWRQLVRNNDVSTTIEVGKDAVDKEEAVKGS